MINNMAKEHSEFEIVVNVKTKLEIWQHCEFVKVKDEVSKTKIACRHCQIELKYSANISNFSDNLSRKHSAVSLLFFCNQHFLLFPQSVLAPSMKIIDINLVNYLTRMLIFFLKVADRNCRLFHSQKQKKKKQFAESAWIRQSSDIKLNNTSKYLG